MEIIRSAYKCIEQLENKIEQLNTENKQLNTENKQLNRRLKLLLGKEESKLQAKIERCFNNG